MSVMLVATMEVDPARVPEFLELHRERKLQTIRMGANDHRVFALSAAGAEVGRWVGVIEFDSNEALGSFMDAQGTDPEAQASIAKATGPEGPARVLSLVVAQEVTAT